MPSKILLTKDNWRSVALAAVEMLPEDIKVHVGHSTLPDALHLLVAGNPVAGDDDGEASITRVTVKWWDKLADDTEYVASAELYAPELYGPDGILREQLAWPVLSIESDSGCDEPRSLFPGRCPAAALESEVRNAVLEALHSGGGWSVVLKDDKGRFVREDGSRIVPQRKRKS
jgi:hypothetical protein